MFFAQIFSICIPPHCWFCHNSWWAKGFDWKNFQPIRPSECPACSNIWWKGQQRARHYTDLVLAFCPVCDRFLRLREKWLGMQRDLDPEGEKALLLPVKASLLITQPPIPENLKLAVLNMRAFYKTLYQ